MKFGQKKFYKKGDRMWVYGWDRCGVATVVHVWSTGLYTVEFDLGSPILRDAEADPLHCHRGSEKLKPATKTESRQSALTAFKRLVRGLQKAGRMLTTHDLGIVGLRK